MRTNIVAGNWKMNNTFKEADDLIFDIVKFIEDNPQDNASVILCPPAVYLRWPQTMLMNRTYLLELKI